MLYILAINAAAFGAFAIDKGRAERGQWRISERTLLMLAAAGGTSGAMAAQQLLHHKTSKGPFVTALWLVGAAQMVMLASVVIVLPPKIPPFQALGVLLRLGG